MGSSFQYIWIYIFPIIILCATYSRLSFTSSYKKYLIFFISKLIHVKHYSTSFVVVFFLRKNITYITYSRLFNDSHTIFTQLDHSQILSICQNSPLVEVSLSVKIILPNNILLPFCPLVSTYSVAYTSYHW